MDRTERIGLPLLAPGQLQKEVWINEGLLCLDSLLYGTLDGVESTQPPAIAPPGRWYRVAAGAVGDWSGHDGELASMTAAGWRFAERLPVPSELPRAMHRQRRRDGGLDD